MPAKNSTTAKKPHLAARAKSARGKRAVAKAHAAPPAIAAMPKAMQQAVAASHEYALAGLGMVSRMRKEREARMAELVAEGKRVESKIQQAFAEYKDTVRSKIDAKKFSLPKLNLSLPRFDSAKLRRFGALAARQ